MSFDLMSVALHELGHGLGFVGSMNVSGGIGTWGAGSSSPFIYDRFAVNGLSQALLNTSLFPNGSPALAAQVTGNSVFFTGANARSGNSGNAARLYAPNPLAKLGRATRTSMKRHSLQGHPNSLMTPELGPGEAIHDPGNIARGTFLDMMGPGAQVPPVQPTGFRVVVP